MARTILLEWRLALSQHRGVLLLALGLTAVAAWGQEPLFLRSHGIELLWQGTAAMSCLCFFLLLVAWLHQARHRVLWSRNGVNLGLGWLVASGLALTMVAWLLLLLAALASITLDSISSLPLDWRRLRLPLRWLALPVPVAFLAPGLAFAPIPLAAGICICGSVVAGGALLGPPVPLDGAAPLANLLPATMAALGSLGFSVSLQRAFRP